MKSETKLSKQADKPFVAGVWLNESEIEAIISRLPSDNWTRADLIEKLKISRLDAERQTKAYFADNRKVIDL